MTEGPERDYALQQIEALGQEPFKEDPESGQRWRDLETESQGSAKTYPEDLAKLAVTIGCGADEAPYVLAGLIQQLDNRFENKLAQKAQVADAFLHETDCPGARGLSEENKTKLREMRRF